VVRKGYWGTPATYLPAILLTPGEQTALTITTHESIYFLSIQTPRPRSICRTLARLKVDPVFVQQVKALLLVIFPKESEDTVSKMAGSYCIRGCTDRRYRVPSGDPYCTRMKRGRGGRVQRGTDKNMRERATNASPKSLSLICPSGSNKKFCMVNNRYQPSPGAEDKRGPKEMKEMSNNTYVRFNVTVDKPELVTLFNGEHHLQQRIRMKRISDRIAIAWMKVYRLARRRLLTSAM
jgi:hypothetical protein